MKYPSIAKQPRRVVSVPALSGGVNLRDSVSMINDNQLTECKNLWENGGVLETRPPCEAFSQKTIGRITSSEFVPNFKTFPHIKKDGKVLCSAQKMDDHYGQDYYAVVIFFWWQGVAKNDIEDAGTVSQRGFDSCNWFVIEKDGKLYCYITNLENLWEIYINENADDTDWRLIEPHEYYAPRVLSGCKPLNIEWYGKNYGIGGTQIEGYNLISKYYKMQYTGVNRELFSDTVMQQKACYGLIYQIDPSSMYGQRIKFSYINNSGETHEHEVTIDNSCSAGNGWYVENFTSDNVPSDNYYLAVNEWTVRLCSSKQNVDSFVMWDISNYVCENNVEIIAPCPNTPENFNKVFKMTQAEWFGGSAKGINGGAHLFLTGNTAENEGALAIWSGLNNPLYFSENNYAYVGNKSQNATAFGKQGEKLIIFKENETYYTCYQENDDITGDDLINQNVIDLSASSVYFPMILINGSIGCDCPDTVQLCRNRLVWAHSSGKVYTLSSENQYSERTIFEVSEMIGPKLRTERSWDLQKATSADFEGHYMLFVENRVYLMSYNSYGYQYVYSFSKNEDANLKIPWYMWELPLFTLGFDLGSYQYPAASVINDRLVLISFYNAEGAENVSMMAFSINPEEKDTFDRAFSEYGDKTAPIESYLQTKIFDFGAPNYRKNVETVQLSLGNNGGAPIEIQYITDSGAENETIVLSDGDTEPRSAAYVTSITLNPCIKSVVRFGMKLSCKGALAVDSMSLHYRLLGGAR